MNGITGKLKPEKLWYYFEQISAIPRPSGREHKVIDYLVRFAEQRGLKYQKDQKGNVVIVKPPSPGYETRPAVVLQAHVDMVCEKNASVSHNCDTDPIQLKISDDWITADGTSLGADNGLGAAAMLCLLQDDAVQTGKLECLFTVEEEIGLNGALGLEPSMISGRMLVNLDTEEVGAVYIGCAGGKDSYISRQMNQVPPGSGKTAIKLEITSLRGGHSGAEIHKGRANALVLMARTLNQLRKKFTYHISSIRGGDKHNAIPREAFSEIVVDSREAEGVQGLFQEYCCKLKNEYSPVEDQMAFRAEPAPVPQLVFDSPSTALMANVLMCIPHGVVAMSRVMEGLVETSTNFAYLRTHGGLLDIHLNHRSSIDSALERVCDIHACITRMANAHIEHKHGYPGWTPDPQSRLLEHARRAVRNVTGKDAVVRATHAGLECGVIKSKFQDMEAVSIGPTIRSPHSPDEKLEIASVEVFWNILVQTLKEIAQ